jgi:sugar phosphate isomerase/epimerase
MQLVLSACLFLAGIIILAMWFWYWRLLHTTELALKASCITHTSTTGAPLAEVKQAVNLGIATGYFYDKDILETIPLIKEAGFQTIEVWAGPHKNGEYVHFNWHQQYVVQALAVFLRTLGLNVHSLHAPFSDTLDLSHTGELRRRAAVNEVIKSMDVLKFLGGQYLVIHPASNETSLHDRNAHFRQSRRSIEEIAQCMDGTNLKLAVENQLPHILGGDVQTLLNLVEGLPADRVGICFDTSHANLYQGRPVEDSFNALAARVMTLHISDNYGHADDHFIIGDGHINWRGFVAALTRAQYQGVFMMEVVSRPQTPDVYAALKSGYTRAADLLKPGFAG